MKLRILPSSPSDTYGQQPLTTYLLNDNIALDAGALGIALPMADQLRITDIILTHAHLDHIATLPTFLDNVFGHVRQPVRIHGTEQTIESLKKHIFNNEIWPDFSLLSNRYGPVMEYCLLEVGRQFEVGGLKFYPVLVNHPVPTIGVVIEEERGSWLMTSDTAQTEEIWRAANQRSNLRAVFTDVSFPNRLDKLAASSGHLTPATLVAELKKLTRPSEVFAVHLKTCYQAEIMAELAALRSPTIRAAKIGRDYIWD